MRKACPFCGSGETRIIPIEDSWTEAKNIRVVCETCDAMGTAADTEEQAERFWNGALQSDATFKRFIGEDAVGGVSGPMTTALNTPGMGNAQPAASAGLNTDGPSGSGDKWNDSSIGMQTNESEYVKYDGVPYEILDEDPNRLFIKSLRNPYGGAAFSSPMSYPPFWVYKDDKKLVKPDSEMYESVNEDNRIEVDIEPDWTGKYITITAHDIGHEEWMELGDNLDQDQLNMAGEVKSKYGISRSPHQMKYPTDVSYTDYGYSDKIGRWSASTLQDAKNWLELHKDKVYSNSPILNENEEYGDFYIEDLDRYANREFGLNFDQLGRREKEWVFDELAKPDSEMYEGMFGNKFNLWIKSWERENTNARPHIEEINGKQIKGFLVKVYPYDYDRYPDEKNSYNGKTLETPVELFLEPLFKRNTFKVYDLDQQLVIRDSMEINTESNYHDLQLMVGGWSGPTVLKENNLNPYDKIGAMMAKKMGVAQPFKKKDYRTNTIKQNHYDELDEDQPDNTRDFDDYVARPDEVLNNAKKRRVNENKQPYRIDTLDDYVKASKHVPDHPLTLVKKKMIKEEAPRDNEALKDVAAKPELETLGVAYEFKAGPSGQERVFITDPMSEVMDKIAQSDWEEYGKNPQNTIRKWSKGDKILTIYADGKQLPRATVTAKGNEVVEEKLVIKRVVPNSINPYL